MVILAGDPHEVTAQLAYQLWEQRGRPFGSPELDWFAAEKALASSERHPGLELPLYSIAPGTKRGSISPMNS
jgi:hypothetical protein